MCVGLDEDLDFVLKALRGRDEPKNRGRLGRGRGAHSIDMLCRVIELADGGEAWEGDLRHRHLHD